jgi:hypothetical protein
MLRFFSTMLALTMICFTLLGCGKAENQTVDTDSELWKQREAFYADPNNAVEEAQPKGQ